MKKTLSLRLMSKPWLRAQICAAAMGSVLLLGTGAYASHHAKAIALKLGAEILSNAAPTSAADSIEFNGAHFYFSTAVLNAKLDDVLNGAEAICKREGADFENQLGPVVAALPSADLPAGISRSDVDLSRVLTVRADTDQSGEVGCWVRRSTKPKRTVLESARAFAESFDLAEFGSLQFVHAEQHGGKTFVRVLWSEGTLSLRDVFPENRDTPGRDLESVPRPVGSFRVLSAHIQNAGRHVVGYQSPDTPQQINGFYGAELPKLGWHEIDLGQPEVDSGPLLQHAYEKPGRRALLALTPSDDGTGTTWVELPAQ